MKRPQLSSGRSFFTMQLPCIATKLSLAVNMTILLVKFKVPRRSHKHKGPTNHDFWFPPDTGPFEQNVRSLCLCGLLSRQE